MVMVGPDLGWVETTCAAHYTYIPAKVLAAIASTVQGGVQQASMVGSSRFGSTGIPRPPAKYCFKYGKCDKMTRTLPPTGDMAHPELRSVSVGSKLRHQGPPDGVLPRCTWDTALMVVVRDLFVGEPQRHRVLNRGGRC